MKATRSILVCIIPLVISGCATLTDKEVRVGKEYARLDPLSLTWMKEQAYARYFTRVSILDGFKELVPVEKRQLIETKKEIAQGFYEMDMEIVHQLQEVFREGDHVFFYEKEAETGFMVVRRGKVLKTAGVLRSTLKK